MEVLVTDVVQWCERERERERDEIFYFGEGEKEEWRDSENL